MTDKREPVEALAFELFMDEDAREIAGQTHDASYDYEAEGGRVRLYWEAIARAALTRPASGDAVEAAGWRTDIEEAPRPEIEIEGLYPDGSVDRIFWREEGRHCVLGSRAGSYPPGWCSKEADCLPVEEPLAWRTLTTEAPAQAEAMALADELEGLAKKATAGPWEIDSERDCEHGFNDWSLAAEINGKWRVVLDTINSDLKEIEDDRDGEGGSAWDAVGQANLKLVAALVNNLPTILATLRQPASVEAEPVASYYVYRHTNGAEHLREAPHRAPHLVEQGFTEIPLYAHLADQVQS